MPIHEGELRKFIDVPMLEAFKEIVDDLGLLSFRDCSLTMLDGHLLTTFVEQWHKDTSSFHLSFGEMAITLDDVSSIFHLPLAGSFFTVHLISLELTRSTIVQDLGVVEEQVIKEFRVNMDAHFRLS